MKKLLLLLTACASTMFLSAICNAQVIVGNFGVNYVTAAPSGSCSSNAPLQSVIGSGAVYSCQNGTWATIGGGGSSITLTTTGTSGAATLIGGVLNIPVYSGGGTTTNALTMNNSGTGASSGSTFNGSAATTISYNSIGASPLAGSTSLTTLGTIVTGTWNATTIGAGYGGTGVANTATLTLGTSNQNWATLGTGIVKNTTTTGALTDAASSDVIGLFSGTCSSSTYLRGDGSCNAPSVSGLAFPVTVSGTTTSGGIPYFSSTTTLTSSALLTQYGLLVGGGAGAAPTALAVGGLNFPLVGGGASANPAFSTITYPSSATSGGVVYASSTTALSVSALLASTDIVIGGGAGTAPSTDANASLSTGTLSLGASGTLGAVKMGNATSGTLTLEPVTGALGAVTVSIPAATDTLVNLTGTQTLTNKTLDGVSPTTMGYVDPTSSIQTQLGGKQATIGYTPTNAAIVPSTVPSAGQDLVGNAGGTAYAAVSMSGDCTRAATGAITCTKSSGAAFGTAAFDTGPSGTIVGTTDTQTLTNKTIASSQITLLPLSCQPGLGDGLNAIPAGTYLQTTCRNETGITWTLTSIRCVADSGSSTCNVTNGAGTGLLTGAIVGTSTYANGTQSGTTTIASGDYLKITFVADGTSKQIGIDVSGTY